MKPVKTPNQTDFYTISFGIIFGILGGGAVGGPLGCTIGAVGGLYGTEWLLNISSSLCSECSYSKFLESLVIAFIVAAFFTFVSYYVNKFLFILLNFFL